MNIRIALELLALAALWGSSFLFMRVAAPEFGAVLLIELRVVIASLVLVPIWWVRRGRSGIDEIQDHWPALVVVGALNSAIPFVLFAYSVLFITGGFASILNATAPIWGALIAWLWMRQSMTFGALLGLLLGMSGVVILVSGSLTWSFSGASLGILAAGFAPFLYGIAANVTSNKLGRVNALTIATGSMVAASLLLFPVSLLFLPDGPISLKAWLSVIALAALCTSLAYFMYFRLIEQLGATRAITVTFLIPVFGMFWGAVFLDELVTLRMLAGSAVILFGTALVTGAVSLSGFSQKRH